jgi:dUTP pyrophosphatase
MSVQIKLLNDKAVMPTRGTEHSAGFDLYAPERVDIPAGQSYLVGTGISMAIPNGWFGQINPRSSLASKKKIRVGARVIDADYRGEVFINLHNDGDTVYEIKKGDRIAQVVFMPFLGDVIQVDELDDTERGNGGFGSTGI